MAKAKKTTKKTATLETDVTKKKEAKKAPKDDARKVAKASNGKLDIAQVRILRVLHKNRTKRGLTRDDIKEAVGIGREGKYSGGWLKSLWDLDNKHLITTSNYGDDRKYYHLISETGKKVLERAEKDYKKNE